MLAGGRAVLVLLRNLTLAALLYVAIYFTVELASTPAQRATVRQKLPSLPSAITDAIRHGHSVDRLREGKPRVNIGSEQHVKINPHANTFNRPSSAVAVHDGYFGQRPHVDMEADLDLLVKKCRGTYLGIEKVRDVQSCMEFLAGDEHRYYYLPALPDRASEQKPMDAEYLNADGEHNTLAHYPESERASEQSCGRCNGPILPIHVYWAGPATWRVEVFIKSYLHTQNLPCTRLWLWLDADRDPDTVDKFLHSDPVFARFLPLVERGDIKVLSWNFPTRMPLPSGIDHTDGFGYYKDPGPYDAKGERAIADGIFENIKGEQFIQLKQTQMTFFAQAISDAVRFVILHLHGGLYLDMDVLILRDLRPLLLPQKHDFAERWAAHSHAGDFNTAILSLSANSSLSSYLLRGGVRMGLNFHPRVIGRMAWKDGRDQELLMLETAAFDPIWTEFNGARTGRCTVPCLKDYGAAFKGKPGALTDEWESYAGHQLTPVGNSSAQSTPEDATRRQGFVQSITGMISKRSIKARPGSTQSYVEITGAGDPLHSWSWTAEEEAALRDAGLVLVYRKDEDKYPPNNRTMQNFFRGAWTYHIHNRWMQHPEPSSWLDVVQRAHDRFFDGGVNPYGETWDGPSLTAYNKWPEFV